jgi:hypothetical protein
MGRDRFEQERWITHPSKSIRSYLLWIKARRDVQVANDQRPQADIDAVADHFGLSLRAFF